MRTLIVFSAFLGIIASQTAGMQTVQKHTIMTHLCPCSLLPRPGPHLLNPYRTEAPPNALASWRSRTGRQAPSKMTHCTTAPPRWEAWKCVSLMVVLSWRNHLVEGKNDGEDSELRFTKVNVGDDCRLPTGSHLHRATRLRAATCIFPALGQCFISTDVHIFQPPGWLEVYKCAHSSTHHLQVK